MTKKWQSLVRQQNLAKTEHLITALARKAIIGLDQTLVWIEDVCYSIKARYEWSIKRFIRRKLQLHLVKFVGV